MNRLALVALLAALTGCATQSYPGAPTLSTTRYMGTVSSMYQFNQPAPPVAAAPVVVPIYRPIVMPHIDTTPLYQPVQPSRPIQFDPVPLLRGPSTTNCTYAGRSSSCVTY